MCSLQEHMEREIRARETEPETADSATSTTTGSLIPPAVLALIEEAEQRHGTSMYCKVTTYELRQALGQDVAGWPDERMSP